MNNLHDTYTLIYTLSVDLESDLEQHFIVIMLCVNFKVTLSSKLDFPF